MIISVTKRDIERGIRRSRCLCLVARAIRRRVGGMVWVNHKSVYFQSPYDYTKILPAKASEFIRTFDVDGKRAVKPMRFALSNTSFLGHPWWII